MKRTVLTLALILLCAPLAAAQDWAKAKVEKSPRHREWVTVEHDNRTVETFVVYPEVRDKAPAVVVIHEIFGLSDWARITADQVAAAGYIAIAPDLLSGMGPDGGGTDNFGGAARGAQAIQGLPPDQVTADLNASRTTWPSFRRAMANCPWADSAGAAARPSASPPTTRTSRPRSCSTARAPSTRKTSPASRARLRLLRRQRRARGRHDSDDSANDESRGKERTSPSPTTAPATVSCAPAKPRRDARERQSPRRRLGALEEAHGRALRDRYASHFGKIPCSSYFCNPGSSNNSVAPHSLACPALQSGK